LTVLEERYSIPFQQCGLILNPKFPVFRASPDAISQEHVVEIKCPINAKSQLNYLNSRGDITSHCEAQV
jgi:hypothetical protein